MGCRAALEDGSCCAGESGVLSRALFTGASHQAPALCQVPKTAENETYMSQPSGSQHPAGCVFSGLLRGRREDPEEGSYQRSVTDGGSGEAHRASGHEAGVQEERGRKD